MTTIRARAAVIIGAVAALLLAGLTPASAADDWRRNCPTEPYSFSERTYSNGATVRRHELREGDQTVGDATKWRDGRQRCEMKLRHDFPMGEHLWFAYSFRWNGTMSSKWVTMSQLHQSPQSGERSGKPPAFTMRQQNGVLQFLTRSDTRVNTTTQVPEVLRYSRPWFQPNQWHDVVVRVKFDPFGAGSFTVWINGVKEYWSGQIPIGYNDTVGPHFAHGQYRGAAPNTTVFEFANVEIGTDTLMGRTTNPLPVP